MKLTRIQISIVLIIALFIFIICFWPTGVTEKSYDFIENADSATIDSADIGNKIDITLRDNSYRLVPRDFNLQVFGFFNRGNNKIETLNLNNRATKGPIKNAVIQLMNSPDDNQLPVKLTFRKKSKKRYFQLQINKDDIYYFIELIKVTNGRSITIDKKFISANILSNSLSQFTIVIVDNYIFAYHNFRLLLYYNNLEDTISSPFVIKSSGKSAGSKFSIRLLEIKDIFYNVISEFVKDFFNESEAMRYYWNKYYPNHLLYPENEKAAFAQRVKQGGVFRRSLVFPVGHSVTYNLSIPENSSMDFAISMINKYVISPDRVKYEIEIEPEGEEADVYPFRIFLNESNKIRWQIKKLKLEKYWGKECIIRFRATLDKDKKYGEEDKIVVLWGNPVIRTKRKTDERNVIVILLDTLNPSHLGCYGHFRDTSPNIDKFSKEGVLFKNAISGAPWTLPSHMTIFSGLYPTEAGYANSEEVLLSDHKDASQLSTSIVTIPEYLKAEGYNTAAFIEKAIVIPSLGFDQGFEVFTHSKQDIDMNINKVLKWISSNKDSKFFLFFHTFEPHFPFKRKFFEPRNNKIKEVVTTKYDSGIKYTDDYVGYLLEHLKSEGLYDNTLIILLSDHGTTFEFDFSKLKNNRMRGLHGMSLSDNEIKVPLIIGGDIGKYKGRVIDTQVQSVDLLPTILDYLDIEEVNPNRGQSLFKVLEGKGLKKRYAFSEGIFFQMRDGIMFEIYDQRSLRSNEHKFVKYLDPKKGIPYALYDLKNYKNELVNVADNNMELCSGLDRMLTNLLKKINENAALLKKSLIDGGVSKDIEERLRSLGYIQ